MEVVAEPVSSQCADAFRSGEHVVLGMSPFNSYFSLERITALLTWAHGRFDSFHVFVPDEPAAYTLEALGYEPNRARRKAKRQANYLRNKIRRAGAEMHPAIDTDLLLLDWAVLQRNPRFHEVHARVLKQFDACAELRGECLDASAWVLHQRNTAELTRVAVRRATDYFLAEMPMFVGAAPILGRAHSVFAYHEAPPVLQRLYRRELSILPATGQGFVVVRQRDRRVA